MEKSLRDEMVKAARQNGTKHGKVAELDFGAGAEWMYEKLAEEKLTDTQHLKAEIRSVVDDFVCIPPVRIAQEIDNLIYKLRELSAV